MTQRTWAALLAVPLFVALGLYIAVTPMPFVTYAPGLTVNVLGEASSPSMMNSPIWASHAKPSAKDRVDERWGRSELPRINAVT